MQPRFAEQALEYMRKFDLPEQSRKILDRFSPPVSRTNSPEPELRAEFHPVPIEHLRRRGKDLYLAGKELEAFEQYRYIVEHCDRRENDAEYDKAVTGMSDIMRQPNNPISEAHYSKDKMIFHLEMYGQNVGDTFFSQQHIEMLVDNIERNRVSDEMPLLTRQTGQRPAAVTQVKPMRLPHGQLVRFEFSAPERGYAPEKRLADAYQRDIPGKDDDFIRGNIDNPVVPPRLVKQLEYWVVDDPHDVNRRIQGANDRAENQRRKQNPHKDPFQHFNTLSTLRHGAFRGIEDSGSETSPRLMLSLSHKS